MKEVDWEGKGLVLYIEKELKLVKFTTMIKYSWTADFSGFQRIFYNFPTELKMMSLGLKVK